MITTDECENCKYGTVIENSKADIKVYCSVKDKYYYYGQCIPCINKTEISEVRMIRKQELMYQMFGKTEQQKCRDCKHLIGGTNQYRKCEVYGMSHSEATDWALKSDACGLFNKDYDGDVPIVKLVSTETKEVQVEGQMRLDQWLGQVEH